MNNQLQIIIKRMLSRFITLLMTCFMVMLAGLQGGALALAGGGVSGENVVPLSLMQASNVESSQQSTIHNPRLEIYTELGMMRIELYPEKAPQAVSKLIELVGAGYYRAGAVMESRPGVGLVIAKVGDSTKEFDFKDDGNDLKSRRGSLAISKSYASNAYLNNLFVGYGAQADLEMHYVIIGQVIEGLDDHERARPATVYAVEDLSVLDITQSSTY